MDSLFAQAQTTSAVTGTKAADASRFIQWVITHKQVDELKNLIPFKNHKSVSVRRLVAKAFSALGNEEHVDFLNNWKATEPDREAFLLIESAVDAIERRKNGEVDLSEHVLSVGEAIKHVKEIISKNMYTVEGEVSELKLVHDKMYYFNLKDTDELYLKAWAFAGVMYRAGFTLNEGLKVRVRGTFKLSKSAQLYFDVQHISLTGEGELLRNLKQLEEKLRKEGLFDITRKRKLTRIPKSILLIASPNSAALLDFVKVITERRSGLSIYLLPIKTQGVGAEFAILDQLRRVNELTQTHGIDTIVLTRGGGSIEDLQVFNSEKIARMIHSFNRPTVVAIGHERDTTICELVADVRASTPSNAAELTSMSSSEVIGIAQSQLRSIRHLSMARMQQYRDYANASVLKTNHTVNMNVLNTRAQCNTINSVISKVFTAVRMETHKYVTNSSSQIAASIRNCHLSYAFVIPTTIHEQSRIAHNLAMTIRLVYTLNSQLSTRVQNFISLVELEAEKISLSDPQHILKRGYASVMQENKIVLHAKDIASDASFFLEMHDKTVTAQLTSSS